MIIFSSFMHSNEDGKYLKTSQRCFIFDTTKQGKNLFESSCPYYINCNYKYQDFTLSSGIFLVHKTSRSSDAKHCHIHNASHVNLSVILQVVPNMENSCRYININCCLFQPFVAHNIEHLHGRPW